MVMKRFSSGSDANCSKRMSRSLLRAHDDGDLLALLAEGASNRVGDGEAHAAANDGYTVALDLGRAAERSGDVLDLVAFVELGEALGRLTHDHEDELDPTLLRVPVSKGERDALARLVDAHHEELTGMGMLGHPGCVDAELEDLLRELRLLQDLEHRTPLSYEAGRLRCMLLGLEGRAARIPGSCLHTQIRLYPAACIFNASGRQVSDERCVHDACGLRGWRAGRSAGS